MVLVRSHAAHVTGHNRDLSSGALWSHRRNAANRVAAASAVDRVLGRDDQSTEQTRRRRRHAPRTRHNNHPGLVCAAAKFVARIEVGGNRRGVTGCCQLRCRLADNLGASRSGHRSTSEAPVHQASAARAAFDCLLTGLRSHYLDVPVCNNKCVNFGDSEGDFTLQPVTTPTRQHNTHNTAAIRRAESPRATPLTPAARRCEWGVGGGGRWA